MAGKKIEFGAKDVSSFQSSISFTKVSMLPAKDNLNRSLYNSHRTMHVPECDGSLRNRSI
ncbi:MAG: hypothetical protein CMJ77_11600 [Planctomycetaceae bacterium]|nr:hypothetical protein [Planctomycetaceae bacterium]